ncbi:FAD-binding protein [Mesorhizobium sp. M1C.F.Ca.ET.193.01.1.1]|uniref:FAD-dependent monooxygenase n=1 Tax=unclassified Mesorhizobium TaxID=325217 RepID=UPI000FD28445|nr:MULTISPECIES: FAD-dependent monooxygenase [unclassified Mesorhizobium]TGS96407.1 FAD-binding protein [bacterium M00.F.Ca.ET.177.01.1.1]TGQ52053.1 FAD-binding protein [Mesorhizobium sp. M1C.F.Ca.ET.210.01.1.1]TGQ68698.1 FAD-binding protein [Mesorhizobium sp. M1C.F.Ca.ET.212.01.1.1]TGR04138.1 FAD-binding protein [Mesorhizobium sp. M1C.F.Ca.ET.204.01.1.1]TGR24802.1 FAD-binding protein [Mesorhizobium sp. M1C.F.Ca.ET.196.01.1.1]
MTEARSRQVVIAGAGIAGLTAALAFAGRGSAVTVLEQARQIEAAGAGLQLSPNATRILSQLGALDRLRLSAIRPEAVVLKDAASLRELARVPLGQTGEDRWGAPYLVAHRADLQAALTSRMAEHPEIQLVTGARVTDIAVAPQNIVVTAQTDGGGAKAAGGLLVGADGVWSSVRSQLAGAQPAFANSRFSGELAWRATVAATSAAGQAFTAIGAIDCVTTFLHPGFHMVAYPVSKGSAFNLAAFTKGERIAEGWSGHADPAILAGAMRGTAPALAKLAALAGPWTAFPIHTVEQRRWTMPEGVALIGDAAHAMTPFAAQGAAMGIEDAAMLANLVADFPDDPRQSLTIWENLRRPRVEKVLGRGALNKLAWHAWGPVAIARNLVLATRPAEKLAADLDWLYGWEERKVVRR